MSFVYKKDICVTISIVLAEQAAADLEALPISMHARYENIVARLEKWPEVSGVKWLTGPWKGHARIRFGDYRLVFHPQDDGERIVIDRIANRRDVYTD